MSSATDTAPATVPTSPWERLALPFWWLCYYLGLIGYGLGVLLVFLISLPASWGCPVQGRLWFRHFSGHMHSFYVSCLRATGGLRLNFEPYQETGREARSRVDSSEILSEAKSRQSGEESKIINHKSHHPGTLLVANHPGLLDFPILTQLDTALLCFHKQALARTPLGPALRACGHFSNREGIDSVHRAITALKTGQNVAIFPEGTRSPPGKIGPFQPTLALLAAKSGAPIQPIALLVSSHFLGKHGRWWLPPVLPIRIVVRAGPVFRPEPGETSARLTARVEAWFHRALNTQTVS